VHIRSSDYKEVKVDIPNKGPKTIKVSADSSKDELEAYKALFLEFQDVFAWSYTDLKGIPAHIAQHTITLLPSIKPIRQKQRRLNPHMQLVLKAKPERLLKAGFIKPVDLVDWVSPMVLVRKKNGKLRVCIDYRALNKYCHSSTSFLRKSQGKSFIPILMAILAITKLVFIQAIGTRQRLLPLGERLFSLSCHLACAMHRPPFKGL
jgi:hypothetical protein